MLTALERGVAGVTLFGSNVGEDEQLTELTKRLRGATQQPLLAIDEEGGDVTRIAHLTGSPHPGNAALGAVDETDLTERVHRAIGADLAAAGINLDLAPLVDVNTADGNPVIGTRAFGADPGLVARHAAAAVRGLQMAGVAACAKHFPGHGSTLEDTHHVTATVSGGLDTLRRRDLPPFEEAIAAGVRGVMTGHLRVPELTGDLPATLSPAALTGLLRNRLGFRGVIVTDALEMRAIRDTYGIREGAVLAAAAGADLLCLGRNVDEQAYLAVRDALVTAVRDRRLEGGRLEEAAARVAELRRWLGGAVAGQAAHGAGQPGAAVGLVAARRAARLSRRPLSGKPLSGKPLSGRPLSGMPPALRDPLVVQVERPANIAVGMVPWGLGPWIPDGDLLQVPISGRTDAGAADAARTVLERAAGRSLIVVVRDAHRDAAARAMTVAVLAARPDTTVVEMGLPVWRPEVGAYLATYGASRANSQAAAEILGLVRNSARPARRGP
ncbi:MAG: glycoside hydrolase family 3 N-terminal domain-containing protein [Micromonosporaceae bacterium]